MKFLGNFPVTAESDIPDGRDFIYQPALIPLSPVIDPPATLHILDQGKEGSCTGFGLAAVINKLNHDRGSDMLVSARMLYEMAKRYDSWPGEDYAGSSCRGAIKGWHSMGVCAEALWPYIEDNDDRNLTIERAKDARSNTIGAYYRINPDIVHMHAALNEVAAVYVSARVHSGWSLKSVRNGVIKQDKKIIGGHAFAIVGYDETGFWVQNSWGGEWGRNGLAHWSYEDWQDNVSDAWVVRLALPTPQLWDRDFQKEDVGKIALFGKSGPRRARIAGHFVHIDDGLFHEDGKYWSTQKDVEETASLVAKSNRYQHLMFYAHGGLNSVEDSATRIAAMRDVFKENGIYPYHFMYDTGLLEEIKDIILGKRSSTEGLVGGFADWWDKVFEKMTRRPGRALWREMKSDANLCFRGNKNAGRQTLLAFVDALQTKNASPKSVHLVGHSTGAILIAHLLHALSKMKVKTRIASVSLMAPAATVSLFETHYSPFLETPKRQFGIDKLTIYNLKDDLEQDDTVAEVYRKSLLYLVSNAFEEKRGDAVLGMQKFSKDIAKQAGLEFVYSLNKRTKSESHGGFDNDPVTMNDVLKNILGRKAKRGFTVRDLDY